MIEDWSKANILLNILQGSKLKQIHNVADIAGTAAPRMYAQSLSCKLTLEIRLQIMLEARVSDFF